jgi:outer membrane cobalamin receptor
MDRTFFFRLFRTLLLCAPGLLCASFCFAQAVVSAPDVPIKVKPTVVEVTAEAVPVEATSASVTILNRSDIEEAHAPNLATLLHTVPFLNVEQNGSMGSFTTVTVRGGKPNFTLVLLNGTPINNITNILGGSVDLSTISPDDIQRIEIVRGPLSSIYGSEAVSGVINIITRPQSDAKTSGDLSVEGGNFGTGKVGLALRRSSHRVSYSVDGSYLNISDQVLSDSYALGSIASQVRFDISKDKLLEAQVRYQHDQDSSLPMNGGGPELSIQPTPEERNLGDVVFSAAFHHQVLPKWLYTLDFNFFREGERDNSPAILDSVHPSPFRSVPAELDNLDFRRSQLQFSNHLLFSSKWTGLITLGLKDENGSDDGLLAGRVPTHFHLDRPSTAANGEIVYNTNRFTASLGSGVDKTSGFDIHPSARAGVNVRFFGGRTTLRTSWASAYQLPSMFALANPTVGNPALQPEKNKAFDVGVEQKLRPLQSLLSLTYFRNSFTDLIDFSSELFKLVNRTNAHTQGVELALSSRLYSKLRVQGDVSYLDWKLENTTEPLRDQPHWQGGIGADFTVSRKLHAEFSSRWVGRRFDFQVPAPLIDSVGGYSTTSLTGSYAVSRRVLAYARIDNLFDRRYHQFLGFPDPGIYARVGVKYRLFGE